MPGLHRQPHLPTLLQVDSLPLHHGQCAGAGKPVLRRPPGLWDGEKERKSYDLYWVHARVTTQSMRKLLQTSAWCILCFWSLATIWYIGSSDIVTWETRPGAGAVRQRGPRRHLPLQQLLSVGRYILPGVGKISFSILQFLITSDIYFYLQALLFYIPRCIWLSLEGGIMSFLVTGCLDRYPYYSGVWCGLLLLCCVQGGGGCRRQARSAADQLLRLRPQQAQQVRAGLLPLRAAHHRDHHLPRGTNI